MAGGRGRRNREAFERFCVDEHKRLVGAVALVIGNVDVAAEAVDEALARAWNRVRKGHDIDSLVAWIRVVAMNVAYDYHRKRALEARNLHRMVDMATPPTPHELTGLSPDITEALRELPRRQREIAVLHFIYDLSVKDIALELHLADSTVKSHLQRARNALYAALEPSTREALPHDVP
jgi:RNA polymerase sigma-70 factor (ECF subfamily)